KKSNRGRLNDFEGTKKRILYWAGRAFIAIMASKGMYETDVDIIDNRRLDAWEEGCDKCEVDPEDYPISPAHVENLDDRLCTWRSHSKNHMVNEVKHTFFRKKKTLRQVMEEVERLKAGGLHTKPGSENGKGYFQHPILQTFVNECLFKFRTDIGVQFSKYFKLISAELMCYCCAIIQFLVEEWDTGVRVRRTLDLEEQRQAYNTHLTNHALFVEKSDGRWDLMREQIFLRAFGNSGASKSAIPVDERNLIQEAGIQADTPTEEERAAWREEMAALDPEGKLGLEEPEQASDRDHFSDDQRVVRDTRTYREQEGSRDRRDNQDRGDNGHDRNRSGTREERETGDRQPVRRDNRDRQDDRDRQGDHDQRDNRDWRDNRGQQDDRSQRDDRDRRDGRGRQDNGERQDDRGQQDERDRRDDRDRQDNRDWRDNRARRDNRGQQEDRQDSRNQRDNRSGPSAHDDRQSCGDSQRWYDTGDRHGGPHPDSGRRNNHSNYQSHDPGSQEKGNSQSSNGDKRLNWNTRGSFNSEFGDDHDRYGNERPATQFDRTMHSRLSDDGYEGR
ncbi:unnamed protein product, partial [Rhizoctonia solani]